MAERRLVALIAVLACLLVLVAPTIQAQSTQGLPTGIQSVAVDEQPLDAATVPITGNSTPEISGRAEPGIPPIEIAVGDGDAVRFTAEVNERGRFRAAVPQALADGDYSLWLNNILIGTFTVQSGAATEQAGDTMPLLDIARVVPYPADFGELMPGIGFLDGRFFTLEEEARRTAAAAGDDSDASVRDIQRRLTDAGWLQRYESRLAVPNADNPETFSVQFSSFVVEYTTSRDASSAFASLIADKDVVASPLVGDESALTLLAGVTPDTGAEYQAAQLVFRVGPMLGMIVYADLLNQEPDLALLEAVAQRVAERAAVVAVRESVPLSGMTLLLDLTDASGAMDRRDFYDVRAGTLTGLYAEDEATRASRIELFSGTTDSFSATTNGTFTIGGRGEQARLEWQSEQGEDPQPTPTSVISIEGESPEPAASPTPQPIVIIETEPDQPEPDRDEPEATEPAEVEPATAQVYMTSALYAFPGESEADAWFTAQRDALVASPETESGTYSEIADAPTHGDASATFATSRLVAASEQPVAGFRIYSRVGAIVAILEIESDHDLPADGAARLMRFQIECIEQQACPGFASVSANIFGNNDQWIVERPTRPAIDEPALAEPTPAPVQEPVPVPIEEAAPAPIEEPAPAPIEEPAPAPVEEPTIAPVEEPAPAPVEESTPPPEEEPAPPPEGEATPPPAEEPAPTEEPAATEEPAPGEQPTTTPDGESTPPPGEEAPPESGEESTPPPSDETAPPPSDETAPPPSDEPAAPPTEEAAPPPEEEPAPEATEETPAEDGAVEENPPEEDEGRRDNLRPRERIRDWRENREENRD